MSATPACPRFGSRLNSMKSQPERWSGEAGVLGWVARQGTISGLNLVDFNCPEHLGGLEVASVRQALQQAGLDAGAICLRYPREFGLGAFTHPDAAMRRKAIDLTLQAGQWARDLSAPELIVWSAYDGYDYSLQVDYPKIWKEVVVAFQEICDAFPELKVSLEPKPTEPRRFFIHNTTGAALLMVQQIDRENMGLTLDFGHCLMAGENPGQSAALVGSHGRLFGVQMNDGFVRPGCEDGLMLGSVHPLMTLEFLVWLQRTRYAGHIYFDTFPENEDPVREAEYNIRRFRKLWEQAHALNESGLSDLLARQDILGVLETLEHL
jgi:xylose isomerase